jgi:hypothetical protein
MKGTVRSPVMVVVLGLITCGIYMFYWIYKTSEEVQAYLGSNDSEMSPAVELLLCFVTCGLYYIYWIYKYSKLIYDAETRAKIPADDKAVLNLVLALVGLSIVSTILMQSELNKVWETN